MNHRIILSHSWSWAVPISSGWPLTSSWSEDPILQKYHLSKIPGHCNSHWMLCSCHVWLRLHEKLENSLSKDGGVTLGSARLSRGTEERSHLFFFFFLLETQDSHYHTYQFVSILVAGSWAQATPTYQLHTRFERQPAMIVVCHASVPSHSKNLCAEVRPWIDCKNSTEGYNLFPLCMSEKNLSSRTREIICCLHDI